MQLLADWFTATVCPAMVSVPLRAAPVVLAATEKLVDPIPDIDAPLVIAIQPTLLVAVHAQLEPVRTKMPPLRPVDVAETVNGETVYVHCASAGRAPASRQPSTRSAAQDRAIIRGPPGQIGEMPGVVHNADRHPRPQLINAVRLTFIGCAHGCRICSRAHDSAIARVIDLHVRQEESMKVECRSFVAGAVAGAALAAGVFAGPGVVASAASVGVRAEAAAQPTAGAKSSSKVVLENDRVRVKEVIFPPGVGDAGMHTHELPHVGVILTAGALVFTEPKKSSETVKFEAGSVGFREANVTHQVANPGKAPMRVIEVELK